MSLNLFYCKQIVYTRVSESAFSSFFPPGQWVGGTVTDRVLQSLNQLARDVAMGGLRGNCRLKTILPSSD